MEQELWGDTFILIYFLQRTDEKIGIALMSERLKGSYGHEMVSVSEGLTEPREQSFSC